jgi:hypothetical protein
MEGLRAHEDIKSYKQKMSWIAKKELRDAEKNFQVWGLQTLNEEKKNGEKLTIAKNK